MEEDEDFSFKYENGHWIWDDKNEELAFINNAIPGSPENMLTSRKSVKKISTLSFKDDVDVVEQLRFRKWYQRKFKPGEPTVIKVQDVKDVVLYTAPIQLLTPKLIKLLHCPTTERFIRAIILFFQYFLQVSEEMTQRVTDANKIRTPQSEKIEEEFRDNLNDLRLILAKEYCAVILGAEDLIDFHHMGPHKDKKSLADVDSNLFECLLKVCTQITWIALGRINLQSIELELNRMFKTDYYNSFQRYVDSYFVTKTPQEKSVLLGTCGRRNQGLLYARSPLLDEIKCPRDVDYKMLGFGTISFQNMPIRLQYMKVAIAEPEEVLVQRGVVLGIIGMNRLKFDSMLSPLPEPPANKTKSGLFKGCSSKSTKSKKISVFTSPYPTLCLPTKSEERGPLVSEFQDNSEPLRPCNQHQRDIWLKRYKKLRKK